MEQEQPIGEVIYGALQGLPWPCRMQSYISTAAEETYLTWYPMGQSDAVRASGISLRQVQRAQVSIYSTQPIVEELRDVVRALKAAGLRVTSAGGQAYDSASSMFSCPIMVEQAVRGEQMI